MKDHDLLNNLQKQQSTYNIHLDRAGRERSTLVTNSLVVLAVDGGSVYGDKLRLEQKNC